MVTVTPGLWLHFSRRWPSLLRGDLPPGQWHLLWAVIPCPVDHAGSKEALCVLWANSEVWWLEHGLWSLFFFKLRLSVLKIDI